MIIAILRATRYEPPAIHWARASSPGRTQTCSLSTASSRLSGLAVPSLKPKRLRGVACDVDVEDVRPKPSWLQRSAAVPIYPSTSYLFENAQQGAELFDLVQSDRERGHVAGAGFYESSISTIAAPVRDHSGRVIAALGVTLASAQIDPERQTELVPRVCAAADELSELLNYRPQSSAQVLSITSRRAGGGHA